MCVLNSPLLSLSTHPRVEGGGERKVKVKVKEGGEREEEETLACEPGGFHKGSKKRDFKSTIERDEGFKKKGFQWGLILNLKGERGSTREVQKGVQTSR